MNQIKAIYQYKHLDGSIAHETIRFEPKDFRQRRPDGKGGYIWNLQDIEPVLYRLPEINNAMNNDTPICIVEGEKDADNVVKLGLQATTCPMGALKWRTTYTYSLYGARVAIIPDKDTAGLNHAALLANELYPWCECVKVVYLPGTGKDVSDWIVDGGTREKLEQLIDNADIYMPFSLMQEYRSWLRKQSIVNLLQELERLKNEGTTRDLSKLDMLEAEFKVCAEALGHKSRKKGGVLIACK